MVDEVEGVRFITAKGGTRKFKRGIGEGERVVNCRTGKLKDGRSGKG